MEPATIRTQSGVLLPLQSACSSHIRLGDIAGSLSKQCRFNGQCYQFYSVAQHSLLVAELMPREHRAYGLLHDAHEAYLGDIVTPVKQAINQAGSILTDMEAALDKAIHTAFGLAWPPPAHIQEHVRTADRRALATEFRDLFRFEPEINIKLPKPSPISIRAKGFDAAEQSFLEAAFQYLPTTSQ